MKYLITGFLAGFLLTLTLLAQQAHYGHSGPALLPDPTVTPGIVRTINASEICAASFRTGPYRNTTAAMKKKACAEYGVKNCPHEGTMEIDHLIPLELGGLDDIKNLWPQPAKPVPGFHEKDKLENYLKAQVCAGRIALIDAQAMLRTDWYSAYRQAGLDSVLK